MSEAIITRNDATLSIGFTDKAVSLKDAALSLAGVIGKVSNPEEQERAVQAQAGLKECLSIVEKARKAAKEPILEYGRTIDRAARDFTAELSSEMMRVSRLVGTYQAEEQKRVAAEKALRNQELAEIERQRQAALAKAPNTEAMDAIDEHFNRMAQDMPLVEPNRVDGQQIRKDYEVTVHDVWALARAHSMCVKLEPLIGEIKNLIRAGVTKIAGVTWKEITKADVRLGQKQKVIEI